MSAQRFELDTRIRVRRGLAPLLLVPAAAVCAIAASGIWWLLIPVAVVFASLRAGRGPIFPARVVATPEGLRVGDRLVPRNELLSAAVRHEHGATFVAFPKVHVEVPNDAAADELLGALELDARKTAVEFDVVALSALDIVLPIAFLVMLFGAMAAFSIFSVAPTVIGALALATFVTIVGIVLSRKARLRAGTDGIAIERTGRKVRFFPHEAIANVVADRNVLRLEKSDGSSLRFTVPLSTHAKAADVEARADEVAAVVRRIREARSAHRDLDDAGGAAALARAGGLTTRAWIERLRALGAGAVDTFRNASVTRDQLFSVVESASATAHERLAATIALRSTLTKEEAPRIRIAAEQCVLPELRERMVRVLETDDDDELTRALEEAEAEQNASSE